MEAAATPSCCASSARDAHGHLHHSYRHHHCHHLGHLQIRINFVMFRCARLHHCRLPTFHPGFPHMMPGWEKRLFCARCPLNNACEQVLFNVTSNVTSMRQGGPSDGSPCNCSTITHPGDCNKKPECRHTGQCGCIPAKCKCGDTMCISGCGDEPGGTSHSQEEHYWLLNFYSNGTEETLDMEAGVCQNTTGEIRQIGIVRAPSSYEVAKKFHVCVPCSPKSYIPALTSSSQMHATRFSDDFCAFMRALEHAPQRTTIHS